MPLHHANVQPTPPTPTIPPFAEPRGTAWPTPLEVKRPSTSWWDAPVTDLGGVGRVTGERAATMGITRVGDLLEHLPVRYLTYDDARPLGELSLGEEATVRVRITRIAVRPTRRRALRIVEASISDATGAAVAVWFNQEYLLRVFEPGQEVLLRGRLEAGRPPKLVVKAHEVIGGQGSEGRHTQGLVPVYPASEALSARRLRELVDAARPYLGAAVENLPSWMRRRLNLPHQADALAAIHFPRTTREGRVGRRRLVLEELVVLQLGLGAVRRNEQLGRPAPALNGDGSLRAAVLAGLPFTLTVEQERVTGEIARDLKRDRPMRRLLQGEVGAGKTVVAALAICQAVEAGRQAALLVPTETLADQHLRTLDAVLAPAGIQPVLVTGRLSAAERDHRRLALQSGTAMVAIGTQALLFEREAFARLGLVVVDEQHRFGVEQRQALADRATDVGDDAAAHLLYMTATPIPRTLALTAYGDLQVSTIRGRPPGRQPVETTWFREPDRDQAYELVREQLRAGRQGYVICPRVEGGEDALARAAVEEAERLQRGPFAAFTVGLAHGAQKGDEKRAAMRAFAGGHTDLLVATTVVEVGIDVPNATIMVIEDADRFGLAQLHQLRGRVGRGLDAGLCVLFADPSTDEGQRRMEAITQTNDGFRLAELDLELRGEGAVLGIRQSGATDLRFARLTRDRRELAEARQIARRTLRDDPRLDRPEHSLLRQAVLDRFAELPRLLDA
jgi:ATP-dependent DNA helicase RecG